MAWTLWITVGALMAGLGVAIGAFGAHGLRERLAPEDLIIFEVGVRYWMYHSFAVIVCGFVATRIDTGMLRAAAICFIVGTAVFSGSLYILVLTGQRWLGAVTPIGGVLFIVGWGLLAFSVRQSVAG